MAPVAPACRSDQALAGGTCADDSFPRLNAAALASFQSAFARGAGRPLGPAALRDVFLGFYIDASGVFVSAIHAEQGCLEQSGVRGEYLAGRDGPPLRCGSLSELLYVGAGARYVPNPLAPPACPADCPPPTSATSSCYDCEPFASQADVVIGRVLDVTSLDAPPEPIALADALPPAGAPVLAVGKPVVDGVVPFDERRVSAGTFVEAAGTGVRTSAFLTTGFSGGPLLDACGRAFGVNVSRVNDLRRADPAWDRTHGIAVSLVALRDRVDAALAFARANPPAAR